MNPAAVRGSVIVVAAMLLVACAVIAVPAFSTGDSAAGTDADAAVASAESDTVVIVADLEEDSSVEEVATEYAKIQSERMILESEDKKVLIRDPGAPTRGDAGAVADLFRQVMGPESFLGPEACGPCGPEPRHDQAPRECCGGFFNAPIQEQQEPPSVESSDVSEISSSDIEAQPDIRVVQEVVERIQDSGDEELRSISDTLQAYLAWLALWGGDDATAAVVSVDRKDDPEDDEQQDGEPYVVDADDEEDDPGEDPEPVFEPPCRCYASETVPFYYTGVTTSGLSS